MRAKFLAFHSRFKRVVEMGVRLRANIAAVFFCRLFHALSRCEVLASAFDVISFANQLFSPLFPAEIDEDDYFLHQILQELYEVHKDSG